MRPVSQCTASALSAHHTHPQCAEERACTPSPLMQQLSLGCDHPPELLPCAGWRGAADARCLPSLR